MIGYGGGLSRGCAEKIAADPGRTGTPSRHGLLWVREHGEGALKDGLAPWPVARPGDWAERVNRPQDEKELTAIRRCRDRGQPFGQGPWVLETAHDLGLESTLRPVGRPKMAEPA